MKAVLRIVTAYFSFLPLQGWANAVGAAVLATGILLTLWAPDARTSITMTGAVALPGALLLTLLPLGAGGLALRFASSRSLMHLRPHGRTRMLLGSTLTLMLVAGIIALPMVVKYRAFASFGIHLRTGLEAADWFLGALAFAVAVWLMMFACSASRILFILALAMPLLLLLAGRRIASLAASSTIVAMILSAWVLFAIWYAWGPRIRRPGWMNGQTPLTIAPLERLAARWPGNTRARAMRQYLIGSSSLFACSVPGVILALMLVVLTRSLPLEQKGLALRPASFMYAFALNGPLFGYMIARRSRYLWFRAGVNRSGLFRLAERFGLSAVLAMFCAGAAVLTAASLPEHHEGAARLVLSAATIGILAICMFYFGLSLTRGWNAADVLAGILGLFVVSVAFVSPLRPERDPSLAGIWIATAVLAALALLLRWHAERRWRALDWRVAKLPRVNRP